MALRVPPVAALQPETAFELMRRHSVTHAFLFPTALKAMMKAVPRPRESYALRLEALMSAGEAVGDAVFDWCRDELGVVVDHRHGRRRARRGRRGGRHGSGGDGLLVALVPGRGAAAGGRRKSATSGLFWR